MADRDNSSHRHAALTGYRLHITDAQLSQACSSHRAYISQTYILDRRAALIWHTSRRLAS
jgi:hypothetical protein